ncbi:MAG: hypothetical protein JXJ20_08780 [Anaerolineae bacterium]|nr:hypothetical protein [Anaerolineae bacterium]
MARSPYSHISKHMRWVFVRDMAGEVLQSGAIAAVIMLGVVGVFYVMGPRADQLGLDLIQVVLGKQPTWLRYTLFAAEHFVLSWLLTLPLLCVLIGTRKRYQPLAVGAVFGAAVYVICYSLLLPLALGKETPWQYGFERVYPSLVVHLAFGMAGTFLSRGFVARSPDLGAVCRAFLP